MAKTKWWVLWDIHSAGGSYNGVKPETAFRKGQTIFPEELVTGMVGTVFETKLVQVEAEGEEEACKIVGEAYGNRGGVAATPHAEKELKFFSA